MYKIFIISLAAILLQSCARCKSFDEVFIEDTIEEYFGMYTKGSYWVYENNDKTRNDSVYVTEYKNEKERNLTRCQDEESTEFKLRSTANSLLKVDSSTIRLVRRSITFGRDHYSNERLLYDSNGSNELYKIIVESDTFDATPYKKRIHNEITINDKLYTGEILELYNEGKYGSPKHLYLQKTVGIIGWSIGQETFNLIKKDLKP